MDVLIWPEANGKFHCRRHRLLAVIKRMFTKENNVADEDALPPSFDNVYKRSYEADLFVQQPQVIKHHWSGPQPEDPPTPPPTRAPLPTQDPPVSSPTQAPSSDGEENKFKTKMLFDFEGRPESLSKKDLEKAFLETYKSEDVNVESVTIIDVLDLHGDTVTNTDAPKRRSLQDSANVSKMKIRVVIFLPSSVQVIATSVRKATDAVPKSSEHAGAALGKRRFFPRT